MFAIAKDCFESQINSKIGYEASLANLKFETRLVDGVALEIKINGFSQKILEFAALFIDNLIEFKYNSVNHTQIQNSIYKMKEDYAPESRITYHTLKNMDLFMKPYEFHDSCILKELTEMLEMEEEQQIQIKPEEFFRDRVLGQIQSIQVLVAGNTDSNQAIEFCEKQILPNLKTQPINAEICLQSTCLHRGIGNTLSYGTVQQIKDDPDDEITGEDKKTFDLIQKGHIKRILWDCVANIGTTDEQEE